MRESYCPDCGDPLVKYIRWLRCRHCGYTEDVRGWSRAPRPITTDPLVVVCLVVALLVLLRMVQS